MALVGVDVHLVIDILVDSYTLFAMLILENHTRLSVLAQLEPPMKQGDTNADNLCFFCHPSSERQILYEDDEIYVIPSLGHFTPGYLLIVYKEHRDCFADVVSESHQNVKDMVRGVLTEEFGSCCFFEHGRVGSCFEKGTHKICYHAHLHCLPIETDFTDQVSKNYDRIRIDEWTDISEHREKNPHYFYTEMDSGEKSYFIVNDNPERQYLRRQSCKALGIAEECANWEEYPYRHRMKKTAKRLKRSFPNI